MQRITEIKLTGTQVDELFPSEGDEGQNVRPTAAATACVAALLNVAAGDVQWHAPDVFDVRYGSNYIATGRAGDKSVRFLSTLGDFLQGDDE